MCVSVCAGEHVCLHNDHSPYAAASWGSQHASCYPLLRGCTHTLTHATPTHSHVTPSLFQHYQSAVRLCVFLQDRLRVMCVSLEDRVCVWWQSVSPVWSLCSLCSLSSDTLCSQATPLVAHWTLRDTPTANPKGAFTGMHQRDTARSTPLKAFKLIFVSLTASFFFLSSARSLPHTVWVDSHSCCAFQSTEIMDSCKLWVRTQTRLIGPFLPTQQEQQ